MQRNDNIGALNKAVTEMITSFADQTKREVEIQVGFMNEYNEQISKEKHINLFYSQIDGMVEVCNEIIDERLEDDE